ncbi:MAG: cell division protein SepF [Ruminococcus sp.]|jgi:FtsZ-interacting cell division protein YlmF|nr:cell division protein SepF [Ruminococcus sp.]
MENSNKTNSIGQKIKDFFMPEYVETSNSDMIDEIPISTVGNTTRIEPKSKKSLREGSIAPIEVITTAQFKVHKFAPVYYRDVAAISESIINNSAVVLNLESPTESERRRLLDFVAGVAAAKNASVQNIGGFNILVLPHGIPFEDKDNSGDGGIVSDISEKLAAGIL